MDVGKWKLVLVPKAVVRKVIPTHVFQSCFHGKESTHLLRSILIKE